MKKLWALKSIYLFFSNNIKSNTVLMVWNYSIFYHFNHSKRHILIWYSKITKQQSEIVRTCNAIIWRGKFWALTARTIKKQNWIFLPSSDLNCQIKQISNSYSQTQTVDGASWILWAAKSRRLKTIFFATCDNGKPIYMRPS